MYVGACAVSAHPVVVCCAQTDPPSPVPIVPDCPSAAASLPRSAAPAACVSCTLPPLCRARRPHVAALSSRGESPLASRVSRSPDSARQAAKPQSPQRLLAAYKYPVCLAACTCAPCAIRFVTNARPKGPAAGNTADTTKPNSKHNNPTTKPTIRPACPRRLRHYLGGAL